MAKLPIPPAPDSNIDLIEFGRALTPKIALPKLTADFHADTWELMIRKDENTSYPILAKKLSKYEGNTVNLEPKALEKDAQVFELTIVKGDASRIVNASRMKVSVRPGELVVEKVFSYRDGEERIIVDAKELKKRRENGSSM